MRFLVIGSLFFTACGGAIAVDPTPAPACEIEAGPVDCTTNDCHVLELVDGGELGTTVRGRCPSGARCIVWPNGSAKYGVCVDGFPLDSGKRD